MLNLYKESILSINGGEISDPFCMYPVYEPWTYSKKWCQDVLDFIYRMIYSHLMWIDYPDEGPTPEELKDIFEQMSQNSPNEFSGLAIWSTHQFYLTDKGQEFLDEWNISGNDQAYWKKLNHIFEENNVGFDKSRFIPVKF
ncbi:hypothetical protein GOB83_04225 [Acetobacter fabarum]|mgnify:FL=1|uniref:hypothetical protein n=1 Tax=Acetobacter fabarum TaxID=483199 RepID=UPI0014044801|nr:hypothetical protein [Acetobacter fabarum]MDN6713537.1 hypothetical protein [Acetobacter sp.]MCP1227535.1 hypothetical protein [Acetobacter fabarum]MCP1233151.1 hypothetical protein [Acetobacter fabarum]NHO41408.1 hypothetical protein [Acetobacter fabarum]GBQ35881.1 hypothetical protein AA19596_1854 [Acetobacter fabarum DSM 19596]